MTALRYLHLLALVVWVGGIVALGLVAAPSTFEVLQARSGLEGRVLAGAVFGEILRRFHLVLYASGGAVLLTLLAMRLLGPPPSTFAWRAAIAAIILALAIVSGTSVSGRIAQLQRGMSGPVAALPAQDPRRVAFGRLHAISTVLMLANLAGGLVLLYWPAREG